MRSVAWLACLLCLVGCQIQSAKESSDSGASDHERPEDAAVEPVADAEPAADAAEPSDPGIELEIDAATPHVGDVHEKPRPIDPVDAATPPADASVQDAATQSDAATSDAAVDAATGSDELDASADQDAALDAGTDLDASTDLDAAADSGADADTDLDASTDAGTDPIDAAADAGEDAGPDAATPTCSGPPGMFKDAYCQVLSDGIRAYHPQYPLWSDGAIKERYIYLPPGKQIDTSNPDRWSFPKGTTFYKVFSWNGIRVETRMLKKNADAAGYLSWTSTSYAWSADQLTASNEETALGVTNALGTPLDIPSQSECSQCHNMNGADAPIGFNAIQLNHTGDGITLTTLLDESLLMNGTPDSALNVSVANAVIPGDATTRAGLGYLHGNCGHCHGGPNPRAEMLLWSPVGMTDVNDAPIFQAAVCQCIKGWKGRTNSSSEPYELRVAPSREALSGIIGRMSVRGKGEQMPRIGTNVIDPTGLAVVKAWIDSLDPSGCNVVDPECP
jgi:hypothetical protein